MGWWGLRCWWLWGGMGARVVLAGGDSSRTVALATAVAQWRMQEMNW